MIELDKMNSIDFKICTVIEKIENISDLHTIVVCMEKQ